MYFIFSNPHFVNHFTDSHKRRGKISQAFEKECLKFSKLGRNKCDEFQNESLEPEKRKILKECEKSFC